jgi:hypothetical protein
MQLWPFALALHLIWCASAGAEPHEENAVRPGSNATRLLDSPARARLEDRGVRWDASYTSEAFATPQLDDRLDLAGLFVLESELDLGALAATPLGRVHLRVFAIHGEGPTADLMDVHGVSGNVADPGVRLFEAWYEQPIRAVTVRGGLLAADQEFVLAEQSSTLLGATFGITSQFSANVLGPVYPVARPAVSARLALDGITVRGAVYDGTEGNETHGIPTALGPDRLAIAELAVAGTFKVGAWHHTELGGAYYAVVDALVEPAVGAFARTGISSAGQHVDTYLDAGIRVTPGFRRDDVISVGLAFAHTVDGMQTVIEGTYAVQIRWLTLQPDVQLLMLRERTALVLAIRVTAAF